MRIIVFLLSMIVSIYLTGCCCCPNMKETGNQLNKNFSNTSNDDEDNDDTTSSSMSSPLDYTIKAQKLQARMQELVEKMSDPNISGDEQAEAEEELDEIREEMEKMQDSLMKSDFIKNSNNPMIKNAMQQMQRAKEEQKKVMEHQQRMMQEMEGDMGGSYPGGSSYDEDFGSDIQYMDDADNQIIDDVDMPESF